MKSDAIKVLERMADEAAMQKFGIPEKWLAHRKYDDRTANGLTRAIVDFIRLNNGQAERVANMGRPVDSRRRVTDVVGAVPARLAACNGFGDRVRMAAVISMRLSQDGQQRSRLRCAGIG